MCSTEQTVMYHILEISHELWSAWWESHQDRVLEDMRFSVAEAVGKMLGCGDPKNGYTKYRCVVCKEHPERIVGLSWDWATRRGESG